MGSLNKMFLFIVSWLGVSLDQIISYVVHLVCQFIRVSHFVHYASAFWVLQRESSFMVFLSHPNLLLILKFFFFFFFLIFIFIFRHGKFSTNYCFLLGDFLICWSTNIQFVATHFNTKVEYYVLVGTTFKLLKLC